MNKPSLQDTIDTLKKDPEAFFRDTAAGRSAAELTASIAQMEAYNDSLDTAVAEDSAELSESDTSAEAILPPMSSFVVGDGTVIGKIRNNSAYGGQVKPVVINRIQVERPANYARPYSSASTHGRMGLSIGERQKAYDYWKVRQMLDLRAVPRFQSPAQYLQLLNTYQKAVKEAVEEKLKYIDIPELLRQHEKTVQPVDYYREHLKLTAS